MTWLCSHGPKFPSVILQQEGYEENGVDSGEEREDLQQQQQRGFSLVGAEVMVEMSSSCVEKLNRYISCLRSFQGRAGVLSDNCVRN